MKNKKSKKTRITKKSIRKLIEAQNAEEKKRLWQRIQKSLEEEERKSGQ